MLVSHSARYAVVKNSLLIAVLYAWVLIVNASILQYDMMYAEQPTLYLVNQTIHSAQDLWGVYAHPKLLDTVVPFFRPSGHFLIYQLLMPVLGWHNTRGMIMVNLFFLALTGYVMLKLYALLFPGRRAGGYLAFAVYAMQPALALSRLTIMHFEFAYVFFVVLSLYYFILFCQKNHLHARQANRLATRLHHHGLLALALLFFVVAATFKEPSLLLGPVMVSYLIISLSDGGWAFLQRKEWRQIIILLTVMTLGLACYLTLPWAGLTHPVRAKTHLPEIVGSINEFMHVMFSINPGQSSVQGLYAPGMTLRTVAVPMIVHLIMWFLIACVAIATPLLVRRADPAGKSVVFLMTACGLFLVLPILWAAGLPWHLSLSLLCFALIMGFSADYLLSEVLLTARWMTYSAMASVLLISLAAMQVNQLSIAYLKATAEGFAYRLDRNAVLHPPALQTSLNEQSVLVVEDSQQLGDYPLGNGGYPFFMVENFNYDDFQKHQQYYYMRYQPLYNGTLFRWAYLMPRLQEEYFQFQADDLRRETNETIYHWLQHIDNIFCVGYDKQANWHDRTALFKKSLRVEQARRHLVVSRYRQRPDTMLSGRTLYTARLPFPDPQYCQMTCDQDSRCRGFSYLHWGKIGKTTSGCEFYRLLTVSEVAHCAACAGYVKL